ncbi:MAG: bifunctional riboflavin kinase/FAD synthetase [Chloroflexota bacterium]|jgi:riboflavin kinase/FMN adenylyltransferase
MQIVTGLPETAHLTQAIATVGVFDGMHRGHRHLMHTLASHAHSHNQRAVVVTFDPHPDQLLRPDAFSGLLQTPAQRMIDMARCGIDTTYVVPFTDEIRQLTAAEFMTRIRLASNLHELWVGWDFALGRGREGTVERLREIGASNGYTVEQITRVQIDDTTPSATRIRTALKDGDVSLANAMLGYRHTYAGVVVTGDKRGRTIGFPTANMSIDSRIMLPKFGVYSTILTTGEQRFASVTNIGMRPTFAGLQPRIEAHVLDQQLDLYDQHVTLELVDFVRPEQKFAGIEALIHQIQIDAQHTRSLFTQLPELLAN